MINSIEKGMFHVKQLLRNRVRRIDARSKTIKGMFHVKQSCS